MATKIGGPGVFESTGTLQVGKGSPVKRASTTATGPKSDQSSPSGETQITDSAKQLAALEQTIKDMPAVDEARVEQVRSSIQNGTYQIDSGKIADKLLGIEKGLHQDA